MLICSLSPLARGDYLISRTCVTSVCVCTCVGHSVGDVDDTNASVCVRACLRYHQTLRTTIHAQLARACVL